jgi:hypothetical protein
MASQNGFNGASSPFQAVLVLLQNRPHSDDLVLAAFGQSLLNFSSSQSFAPLVRDANETVSIRLHDLQITSSHQCTIDARASFEVGCRTKLCPCTSLQQQNFLLSHHGFLPIISSSLASFRDEGPFNSSQLTGEEKPSFSAGNEAAPTMPIGVFRLR